MLLLICAVLVGAVVPIQTGINTRLRQSVGSPIITATYSFIIAVASVALLMAIARNNLLGRLDSLIGQPWWLWLGGFMGVAFIVGNIVIFPRIGAVQTVILPILGQTFMGLFVDAFGLFHYPSIPMTPARLGGAAIVLLGVACVLELPRRGAGGRTEGAHTWAWRCFAVAIGMGSATQTAVNGQLGRVLDSPILAGEISLVVGLVLLLALSTAVIWRGNAKVRPASGPWWMWLGGVLGAAFVIGGATLAPIIGTGTMVIASISGSMITGQVLELRGAFGAPRTKLSAIRIIGLVLIFSGVSLVRFS